MVGLTEQYFGIRDLETALFDKSAMFFYTSSEMGRLIFELLYIYFETYALRKANKLSGMKHSRHIIPITSTVPRRTKT